MPRVVAHPTPNPHSLKFTAEPAPGEAAGPTFLPDGMAAYHSAHDAEGDALGTALFAVRGVSSLLIVPAFVTVTKHPAADWETVAVAVERVLTAHLAALADGSSPA